MVLNEFVEGDELSAVELNENFTKVEQNTQEIEEIKEDITALANYLPAGTVLQHAGLSAPNSFLEADGSAVLTAAYAALTTAIYCGDANNATAGWGYKATTSTNPTANRSTSGTYIVLPSKDNLNIMSPPDFASIATINMSSSYTCPNNGHLWLNGQTDGTSKVTISGTEFEICYDTGDGQSSSSPFIPVRKGDVISDWTRILAAKFIPEYQNGMILIIKY